MELRPLAGALFIFASSMVAQSFAPTQVWNRVVDAAEEPIALAQVSIASSSGKNWELTTDREGNAHIQILPGTYEAAATAQGIAAEQGSNLTVVARMEIDCDIVNCDVATIDEINLPLDLSALAGPFIPAEALEAPIDTRTAHDSKPELATKAQLERLIAAHDLRQWTFTHDIVIDEKSIPHSHPVLTLHARHLKQDDELLSTYLHEQLHWFLERHTAETKASEEDLKKLYPNVPVGYPEGANDTESTYLHLLVCRLEEQADRAVLGEERTAAVMQFWAGDHYRWVYRTVLADGAKIDEILKRHGLAEPDARIADSNR
jgi:hypothetical protein